MPDPFEFELVSPEKLLVRKAVIMVTVPGEEGDYGVLSGHAPMITTVRPGVIEIFEHEETKASARIFVAGGFAEVTNERCTVLAEVATPVDELNFTQLEGEAKDLIEDISVAKSEAEREALETQLAITKAKLQAIATDKS